MLYSFLPLVFFVLLAVRLDANSGSSLTLAHVLIPVWMWLGGVVLVIGTLIAVWPHPARRQVQSVAEMAYGSSVGARA